MKQTVDYETRILPTSNFDHSLFQARFRSSPPTESLEQAIMIKVEKMGVLRPKVGVKHSGDSWG